jgi:hypothetical protein
MKLTKIKSECRQEQDPNRPISVTTVSSSDRITWMRTARRNRKATKCLHQILISVAQMTESSVLATARTLQATCARYSLVKRRGSSGMFGCVEASPPDRIEEVRTLTLDEAPNTWMGCQEKEIFTRMNQKSTEMQSLDIEKMQTQTSAPDRS